MQTQQQQPYAKRSENEQSIKRKSKHTQYSLVQHRKKKKYIRYLFQPSLIHSLDCMRRAATARDLGTRWPPRDLPSCVGTRPPAPSILISSVKWEMRSCMASIFSSRCCSFSCSTPCVALIFTSFNSTTFFFEQWDCNATFGIHLLSVSFLLSIASVSVKFPKSHDHTKDFKTYCHPIDL